MISFAVICLLIVLFPFFTSRKMISARFQFSNKYDFAMLYSLLMIIALIKIIIIICYLRISGTQEDSVIKYYELIEL